MRPVWRDLLDPIRDGDASLAETHRYLRALLRDYDAAGQNVLQVWEREGWLGVRGDRRIVLRAMAGLRLRLLEVVQVGSEASASFQARDLFAGPESGLLEMRDSQFCLSAPLHAAVLAPVASLPHYHMPWMLTRVVPRLPRWSPAQLLRRVAEHLGFAASDDELPSWIEAQLVAFDDLLRDLDVSSPEKGARPTSPVGSALPPELLSEATTFRGEGGWPALNAPWLGRPENELLAWLDEGHRWLDGRTPRAAAAEPEGAAVLRNLLQGMICSADFGRLARRPFVDWTPVTDALGMRDLRHHKPPDWVPPRPGESVRDDQLRRAWPPSLRLSSDDEAPPVVLTEADLERRLEDKRSHYANVGNGFDAFLDAFSLIRTQEFGLLEEEEMPCVEAMLALAYLICPPGTRRYGCLPARVRERASVLYEALVAGGPEQCLEVLAEESRQPRLAETACSLLVKAQGSVDLRPDSIPKALALTVAVLDELDSCTATWARDHG